MAMAFVQGVVKSSAGTPAAAPAFASAVAVGDLIVVYAGTDTATTNRITSISDSLGNSYTRVTSFNVTGNAVSLDAFYSRVTTAGSANVVTIVFNDTADNLNAVIQHFNGFTGIATLDQSAKGAIASATSWTSAATATTAAAAELIVGGAIHSSTVSAFSLGSGFTNLTQSSVANRQIAMESKLVAATGTQTATFTVAAARAGLAGVLTFRDVPAGTTYTQSLTASVSPTGSFSAPTYIPQPTTAQLTDDFNASTYDTVKWPTSYNTSTLITTTGQLVMSTTTAAAYHALGSAATKYRFTNSSVSIKLVNVNINSVVTYELYMLQVYTSTTNKIFWYMDGSGTVACYQVVAGTQTRLTSATYNPATMVWFQLRESSGTTYWEYSADRVTWTALWSATTPIAVSAVTIEITIGNYAAETNVGSATLDYFNLAAGSVYTQSLTASVSPTGTFAKRTAKALVAGLVSTGNFIKQTARSVTASLSPTGSFAASLNKLMAFTASMAMSGTLARQKIITRLFTASMAMTGTFVKRINKPFTAGMTPTATFVKRITRSFVASVTPSGAFTKRLIKSFTAALSPTGSFAKSIRKPFTAGMTSSGSISKFISKNLVATLTPAGSLARQLVKIMLLTADLTFVGSVGILRRMYFAAGLTFSTSFVAKWLSGVPSVFAPLTAIITSTIQSVIDFASRNDTTMSGAEDDVTVQDATSVATVDGAVTITNISANTNTDTLNNPTNKAEL